MQDPDFRELAGRIEGIAQAFLLLAAELHGSSAVDEQLLQAKMRRLAEQMPAGMKTASTTLYELADRMLHHYNDQRLADKSGPGPVR